MGDVGGVAELTRCLGGRREGGGRRGVTRAAFYT